MVSESIIHFILIGSQGLPLVEELFGFERHRIVRFHFFLFRSLELAQGLGIVVRQGGFGRHFLHARFTVSHYLGPLLERELLLGLEVLRLFEVLHESLRLVVILRKEVILLIVVVGLGILVQVVSHLQVVSNPHPRGLNSDGVLMSRRLFWKDFLHLLQAKVDSWVEVNNGRGSQLFFVGASQKRGRSIFLPLHL